MKYLLCIFTLITLSLQAQKSISGLPKKLAETSALILIDEEFYTLNDSGNEPSIYVFNKKGEIIHECIIKNAENYDWEALSYNGTHLFIGDIGNNNNNRKNLRIYKVIKEEVRSKLSAEATVINFEYEGQLDFPPEESERYFDAEAMVVKNDSIFIFTKNRTVPFDGVSRVYYVKETLEGKVEAKYLYDLRLKATHWMQESITDAHLCEDNLYLLTYAKVYWYRWIGAEFILQETYEFDNFTQKEGLTLDRKFFYITDEDESIISGGNHLYKLKR